MSDHEVRSNHGRGDTRSGGARGEPLRDEPFPGARLASDDMCSLTDAGLHQ
jgi:hypothetical protein